MVLVNIDLSKPKPPVILVDMQGERELEIAVTYENCPCSACYQYGHSHHSCPSSIQPGNNHLGLSPSVSIPTEPASQTKLTPNPLARPHHLLGPQSLFLTNNLTLCEPHLSPNPKDHHHDCPAQPPPITSATTPITTLLAPLASPTLPPPQPKPNPKVSSPGRLATKDKSPNLNTSNLQGSSPSFNDLPYDVISIVLDKISTPTIDTSNPFSILENCSIADPTINPSTFFCNLQAYSDGNSSIGLPWFWATTRHLKLTFDIYNSSFIWTPFHLGVSSRANLCRSFQKPPKRKGEVKTMVPTTGPITRWSRTKITSSTLSPC